MELRQLRYFTTVARERNFTRAAELLNIAQPPLSRQIRLLEDEIGVRLIQRDARPVSLTPAGRVFYEQAVQILGRIEQMRAATRRVGLQERSLLSIGFVASTLYGGMPALLEKLREQAPELDIQLVELTSMQQIAALKEGRIDIGFGRIRQSDSAITSFIMHEEPLAVAVSRHSPLATSPAPMAIEEISGHKLILYPREPRPSFADEVLRTLQDHDIQPGEILEVKELQTALGMVAAGFGVCVVPLSASQLRQDVQFRRIDSPRATSPVIFYQRLNDHSPHIQMVKALVQERQAARREAAAFPDQAPH